jgi:hypothetical protein
MWKGVYGKGAKRATSIGEGRRDRVRDPEFSKYNVPNHFPKKKL